MENGEIVFFGLSDGGQDNLNKIFTCITIILRTSATYRNDSHMNFMSASRYNFSKQVPRNGSLKNSCFRFQKTKTIQKQKDWTDQHAWVLFKCDSEFSLGCWAIPWNHGVMACVVFCRNPKTQKWRRWLALRGCPFEREDDLREYF
jgi:hypothetical protein